MSTDKQWAQAFARQADADIEAFARLMKDADAHACHRFQFLQMACEKLAKAHMYLTGRTATNIQTSHGVTIKQLPMLLDLIYGRQAYARAGSRQTALRRWMFQEFKRLAVEIAYLSPSIPQDGSRPDNCEYPWEDKQGNLIIPADFDFPRLDFVRSHAAQEMLKLLPVAIRDVIDQSSGD